MKFPFCFFQKGIGKDHRAANPLAYEVSRAFIPPCIRWDFSPSRWWLSDQPRSQWSAGTLATNSTKYEANGVPDRKWLILFEGRCCGVDEKLSDLKICAENMQF
ncbi:hypothetical protein I8E17_23990 (plasmid) [Rhizobium sp. AB2/73]|nr:hypothetical protein A9Z06_02470 [Rhizobium sp. YK2]QYA14760.1 hypothetical protein J5284_23160 [Rhizobium sp. AB2/73]UEQ83251.1 hypothetical protein I8E17_23990 [Rhizobium sp. AB2/73]